MKPYVDFVLKISQRDFPARPAAISAFSILIISSVIFLKLILGSPDFNCSNNVLRPALASAEYFVFSAKSLLIL